MIIDAHTHAFGSDLDASVNQLLQALDDAGIDRAALFPSPRFQSCSTEDVILLARKHPARLIPVGRGSIADTAREIDRLKGYIRDGTVRAVKFFTGYEPFSASDMGRLWPVLETLATERVPAIFHTGDTVTGAPGARLRYAHPLFVDDAASAFPELPIIIAHFGNPWFTDAAAVMYKNPNVYADISGLVYGDFGPEDDILLSKLTEAYYYLGTFDRVIFGSDFPIASLKSYLEFARRLPLPESERDALLGATAARLFRVEPAK